MPRHQPEYEYVTSNQIQGKTWREIGKILKEETGQGSTAGARNYFYQALRKIAKPYIEFYGFEATEENITKVTRSEDFQMLVRDAMEGDLFNDE